MPTEAHSKDSSSKLLQLLWVCLALKLAPCPHTKFYGIQSKLKLTVHNIHVHIARAHIIESVDYISRDDPNTPYV